MQKSKFREIVEKALKESGKTDLEIYRSALKTFEQVIQKITNTIDNRSKANSNKPITLYKNSRFSNLGADIDTEFGKLSVDFDFFGKYNPNIFGTYIHEPAGIILNLKEILQLDPQGDTLSIPGKKLKQMINNSLVFNTFLHEFTHFYDIKQNKYNPNKSNINIPLSNESDFERYLNLPIEKNAFTMQLIHNIIFNLNEKYGRNWQAISREEKLDYLKNELEKDKDFMHIYTRMDSKSKKRLLSRIYSIFGTDPWRNDYE